MEIRRHYLHLSSQLLNISDSITYCGEVYRVSFANCRIYFITAFNSYLACIPEINSTSYIGWTGTCRSQRFNVRVEVFLWYF